MSLNGPTTTDATLDCILGETCTVELSGFGLDPSSKVMLVPGSCKTGSETGTPLTTSDTGSTATYSATILTGTPGESNKICWAPNPGDASTGEDFPVEVGSTTVLSGPGASSFDCTLTQECVFSIS